MKMQGIKNLFPVLLIIILVTIQSCGKKEEPQTFIPPGQDSTIDKENERKAREEFERLKNEQNGITDSTAVKDSSQAAIDSVRKADSLKTVSTKKESKSNIQKEKELNKRLDNPSAAITDYLELLKRGTSDGGNFEQNMKKASQQWESPNLNRFKNNYKNTKKIIILEEPKVISQKGDQAVVEVRIKKTDNVKNQDSDSEMTVRYNLVADNKGKWKIKTNTVVKK